MKRTVPLMVLACCALLYRASAHGDPAPCVQQQFLGTWKVLFKPAAAVATPAEAQALLSTTRPSRDPATGRQTVRTVTWERVR